jgi:asparagine synthetase B (glutamine-hydrolysing)
MTGQLVGHVALAVGGRAVDRCRVLLGGDPHTTVEREDVVLAVRGAGAAVVSSDDFSLAVSGRLDDGPGSGPTPLRGPAFARWAADRWRGAAAGDLDGWTGDWAVVVVDHRSGEVFAARDLCGGRTVFVATRDGRPVVGTRFAGLCDDAAGPLRPDPVFVCSYLMGRPVDVTTTAFLGIGSVAPGSGARFRDGAWRRGEVVRWHVADRRGASLESVTNEVLELLEQAVRDRLHGLDHAAVALSGGIDSSLVAMLVARVRPDVRRSAVMMAFGDDAGDERDRQDRLSSALGMDQVWVDPMDYEAFGRDGVRATLARDRFPLVPTNWFLSEAMADGTGRAGAPIVLTGEDADSAFADAPAAELAELVARGRLLRWGSVARRTMHVHGWTRQGIAEATAFWLAPMPVRRRARWTRGVFAPVGSMAAAVIEAADLKERLFQAVPASSWQPRDSYRLARSAALTPATMDDSASTLDHFLDRHGAVSGQPFADRRLLSVTAGLRSEHLVAGNETKYVLRRVHRLLAPAGYPDQSSKAVLSAPSVRSALTTQRAELIGGLELALQRPDWLRTDHVAELLATARGGEFSLEGLRVARLAHWLDLVDSPEP